VGRPDVAEPAGTAAPRSFERWLITVLAAALPVVGIAWSGDLPLELGWQIYTQQYLALVLALTLGLVFLHVRADRSTGGPAPWYDLAAAALCLGAAGIVAVFYQSIDEELPYNPLLGLPFAIVLLVSLTEALRRLTGLTLTIIVALFFLYGLVGHLVPGRLAGNFVPPVSLLNTLMLGEAGILGVPTRIAATVVIVFVLFGAILNRAGGSGYFTDLALALMGRYRGGSAKMAIVASSLFGSISGSAVSNVATTGIVTIPLMRKAGFAPATAGGIEAVASTGGQLMPPIMGAAAFLMARDLDVPYSEVVVAALLPALLYYGALFIQADLRAARSGIARIEAARIPRLGRVLVRGWHFPVPFAALIGGIFVLNFEPEKAGLFAAAAMVVLGFAVAFDGARLKPMEAVRILPQVGLAVLDIIVITAAAGIIIGVLNRTGLSFALTQNLVSLVDKSLPLLLVAAAAISILLGMGMPTISVYVLLAALMAPSIKQLGVEPMAAHLFVLYFGMMSMITPPVAIAAFAAASLARTAPMRTAWEAMRFGWPAYVMPFLFVFSPSLILIGEPGPVVLAAATALAGVWLVTAAIVGYFARDLTAVMRLGFALAGLLLLVPSGAFPRGYLTDIAGAALGLALASHEWLAARRFGRVDSPGRDGG